MKKLLLFAGVLLLPIFGMAEDYGTYAIGPFGTLNDTDNPLIIPAEMAQDMLNVELTPGGRSFKKRKGYSEAFQTTTTTAPCHGAHLFYDSNGSDVVLVANDVEVTASIGGATPSAIITSSTVDATMQCTDSQGHAYCVNTARDWILKTNGNSVDYIAKVDTGTIITVTTERLVMAGFSAYPNRIDFSKANDFTTWTVGGEPTDPIQFTITAPGAKVTHLAYAHDRIYWFKDSSFGYIIEGATQLDWIVQIVSPNVGTNDNSSVYWNGALYFRGQDSHLYMYDGANLSRLTRDISTTVNASQTRVAGSWTQSSQAEWEAGSENPDPWADTTSTAGDLKNYTTFFTFTSSSQFNSGTFKDNGGTERDASALNVDLTDAGWGSGKIQSQWPDDFSVLRSTYGAGSTKNVWVTSGTVTQVTGAQRVSAFPSYLRTNNAPLQHSDGTTHYIRISSVSACSSDQSDFWGFRVFISSEAKSSPGTPTQTDCWIAFNVFGNGKTLNVKQTSAYGTSRNAGCPVFSPDDEFTLPVDVLFWWNDSDARLTVYGSTSSLTITDTHSISRTDGSGYSTNYFYLGGKDIETTGCGSGTVDYDTFGIAPIEFSWDSGFLDTERVTPYWDSEVVITTDDANGILSFTTTVKSDGGPEDSAVAVSSGGPIGSANKQLIKFTANFNQTLSSGPVSISVGSFHDLLASAYSSGTFHSTVHNAPSLTSFDVFGADADDNGGSHSFYFRAATGAFTVDSTTPTWVAVTNGAIPFVSTGTYFQFRDDFSATESTHTPTLHSLTINWFEGNAADKAYGHYFDDAVWFSVASGTGASANNKILRYDLLNNGTVIYDIPANGFYTRNQALYIASASSGTVMKYGGVDSDNGAPINAYWKSKDFFTVNPFQDNDFRNLSVSAKSVDGSTVTVTYTIDGSSASAYNFSIYESSSAFTKNNRNLPIGTEGTTFNVKIGNNAIDQFFEIFGIMFGYVPKSWRETE